MGYERCALWDLWDWVHLSWSLFRMMYVAPVAISGTAILVPYLQKKFTATLLKIRRPVPLMIFRSYSKLMKFYNALAHNILNRSQRNFAHVTTVTLSWHVQNVVIDWACFKPKHCEVWSNFEFDQNTISVGRVPGTCRWNFLALLDNRSAVIPRALIQYKDVVLPL